MESSRRVSRRVTFRRSRVRPWRRCARYSRTRACPGPVTTSITTGSCCGGTAWSWPASSTTRCSRASCSIQRGAPMPWPSWRASGWESRCRPTSASWAAGGGSGRSRRCPWPWRRATAVPIARSCCGCETPSNRSSRITGSSACPRRSRCGSSPCSWAWSGTACWWIGRRSGRSHVSARGGVVSWSRSFIARTARASTSTRPPSCVQTGAATVPLSSSDPNLQNIPGRTPRGEAIRRAFVAAPGWLLLTADYSQIELRLLAHLSGDPAFLHAFAQGGDIHRQTAAIIFGVSQDQVTPDMRARAKTINFATIYGQGPFALSRQLGITQEEATEFIVQYFKRFQGVRAWLDRTVAEARDKGYVETLFGRRRYVPELKDKNFNIRA